MKFGVREITDVVFKGTSIGQKLGSLVTTAAYQPLLFLDSAKTSTLESTVATVYAQGGRGNPRLLAWDGDKTVTFKFEDALMSASSFAALSAADLTTATSGGTGATMQLHLTDKTAVTPAGSIVNITGNSATIGGASGTYTVTFVAEANHGIVVGDIITTTGFGTGANGTFKVTVVNTNAITFALPSTVTSSPGTSITSGTYKLASMIKIPVDSGTVTNLNSSYIKILTLDPDGDINSVLAVDNGIYTFANKYLKIWSTSIEELSATQIVLIDYYVKQNSSTLEISAEKFAGYYYLEANTLFRGTDGKDYPAQFTIPKAKIQSNFTFTMASTGDPSMFEFTLDAFPAPLRGESKKVLFTLDIADSVTTDVI